MKSPLINILTRTSNRPNGFKMNVECVKNQTYKNINHIVCTDDENSIKYITELGYKDFIFIDKEEMVINDNSINPNTGVFSPHNLYLNKMMEYVKTGWIIYLDDDDRFTELDVVEKIVNIINKYDEDHLIYWRMVYSDGKFLPIDMSDNKEPVINNIGGSCLTFNAKYKNFAVWDSWKCSDFRVIQQLHKHIPNKVWVPENFVFVPEQGMGSRMDI